MVREGKVAEVEALSELGVFGTWVTQDGRVLLNERVCCLLAKHSVVGAETCALVSVTMQCQISWGRHAWMGFHPDSMLNASDP